jgi:hypothetical protein
MTKDSEVHLKNCLLIHTCSTSSLLYSLVDLVGRVFASYIGGPWIKFRVRPYFLYRYKTSEYSKMYREQLTSEPFFQLQVIYTTGYISKYRPTLTTVYSMLLPAPVTHTPRYLKQTLMLLCISYLYSIPHYLHQSLILLAT